MNIDVVITWVDGQDQPLAARRRQYATANELRHDDVAGTTRYASLDEIFWCVASINRFAPWVHRIFIVTDQQDPHVTPFLQQHFPEGFIPVEIVDHRQIFAGYEEYLPTFSSLSLETMLWRIPGLSEHYLEMNDDFLMTRPVFPEDFFTPEGHPICYATWASVPFTRFTRMIKSRHDDGSKRLTVKGYMTEAAEIAGCRWFYLKFGHTPRALLRSAFEACLALRPGLIERNIRHRFRHIDHFNAEELHYLYLHQCHRLRVAYPGSLHFFLQPNGRPGYVSRKLARLRKGQYKFVCFNGMNLATPAELHEIRTWIADTLRIPQISPNEAPNT